jgi:hypothetical protein
MTGNYTYDWHGINRNGERLITFAKKSPQDGGGYVLGVEERDKHGHLFAAAPALLEAAEWALTALATSENRDEFPLTRKLLREAVAKANGNV